MDKSKESQGKLLCLFLYKHKSYSRQFDSRDLLLSVGPTS